jgi:glutamate racemase
MGKVIGIFDSGVGGLTVAKEVFSRLPYEETVYLGDTARVPYGNKSGETVRRFALECLAFLSQFDLKLVVVACNTVSSVAIDLLNEKSPVPVVGVVESGALGAVQATRNKQVGVIGTKTTITSRAYFSAIHKLDPGVTVFERACPLFVPLVEEGWYADELAYQVARRYLDPLLDREIDTLVLGCTHYPLLKPVIREVMGAEVQLIDSAYQSAKEVEQILRERGELAEQQHGEQKRLFFVTDIPHDFNKVACSFLDREEIDVQLANIEGLEI